MTENHGRILRIFIVACIVGVCSGLFGVGGGVLLVPSLILIFGFEQHRAQGTSLVALVPPTGVLAFLAYYRAHEVNLKVGLLIIPGVFFGGLLGGNLAGELAPNKMRILFAAFLFVLGTWQLLSPLFN